MHRLLTLARKLFKDGSAGRIGERSKDLIGSGFLHSKTIIIWLFIVKNNWQLPFKEILINS
jgi:hypothetical protein